MDLEKHRCSQKDLEQGGWEGLGPQKSVGSHHQSTALILRGQVPVSGKTCKPKALAQ